MTFVFVTTKFIEQATREVFVVHIERYIHADPQAKAELMERFAKSSVHLQYLDDIPVTKQILEFRNAIRKFIPNAKFGVTRDNKFYWANNMEVYTDVWVYTPDEPYARSRVGYGTYTMKTNDNRSSSDGGTFLDNALADTHTYMVYSRTISNTKYAPYRAQYHMMLSKDMERGIKNARAHIRRFTATDYALANKKAITKSLYHTESDLTDKLNEARRATVSRNISELIEELKHLLTIDHTFLSGSFREKVLHLIQLEDEVKAETNRDVPGCFVFVGELRGEQTFDVVHVPNMKNDEYMKNKFLSTVVPQQYKADTLPENIMGKLSVLSIMEEGNYVKSVGQRTHETMFWVEL
jgi:hypothetical protein